MIIRAIHTSSRRRVDGGDTSGVILLLRPRVHKWGPQPALYATMAWAALLMELWGTYLAN